MAEIEARVEERARQNGEKGSEELQTLLGEMSQLKESLRLEKSRNADIDIVTMAQKEEDVSLLSPVRTMKCRKILKGHRSRVLHFDWSPDKSHVLTAGQDGNAVVWDGFLAQKEIIIQTSSSWVLACSYAPSTTLVACSGMNNQCSIYKLDDRISTDGQVGRITLPKKTLTPHSKYVSNCIFFGSDQQLLTSSADTTCALWDIEQKDPVQQFKGHRMEVLGLAIHPKDPFTVFASGGCDRTARVWDARSGQCVMRFDIHESDVNAVRFFPSGEALGTACSDGTIHLFDLRADQEIKFYTKPSIIFGSSTLDFSKSGRILFAGYDDSSVRAWDVIKGTQLMLWQQHHHDRVSHLQLSPGGTALGTCSWDGTMRIWA